MSRPGPSHNMRKGSGRWDNSVWSDNSPNYGSRTSRQFPHSHRDDRDSRDGRDYPEDRYRPRARDASSGLRAADPSRPRADEQPDNKSLEKAEASISKLFSQSHNALVDHVKWSNKKDQEFKAFQRRENDYKKAGETRFPAVTESLERHRASWGKREEFFDNELAKVDALRDKVYNNLAHQLVECLPVGEIKTRQVVESVKQNMQKLVKDTMSTADGRIEMLEKEVLFLKESRTDMFQELAKERENTAFVTEKFIREKESQAPVLRKVTEEQESLAQDRKNLAREQKILAEEQKQQATLLSGLAKEIEKMRSRDALYETQTKSIEILTRDNAQLRAQLPDLQAQVSSLKACVDRVDTQCIALTETSRAAQPQAAVDASVAPHADRLADLERRVNDYSTQISDFNFTQCSDILEKALLYPSWESLDGRLKQLNAASEDQIATIKRSLNDKKDISDVEKDLDGKFTELTKTFISFIQEYSSRMKEDTDQFDNRLKALEVDKVTAKEMNSASAAPAVAAGGPSSVTVTRAHAAANEGAISKRLESLISEVAALRQDLKMYRYEVDQKCAANEGMLLSLDTQFQNITTQEMARVILDQLKRISPALVSQDIQNFHERLARVEAWQAETMQRQIPLKDWTAKVSRYMADDMKKRSASNEQHRDRQDKRARIENGA